jgi:hypothetical protein
MTTNAVSEEAALQEVQDFLVEQAEQIVRLLRGGQNDAGKTQLSRAIDVAMSADTLRVFLNWLRYQGARERSQDFWQVQCGNDTVIHIVERILNDIDKRLKTKNNSVSNRTIMRAVTLFLGYLRRAYIAKELLQGVQGIQRS